MDARLQRRVQRYGWDKAADFYDKTWQAQLWPAQSRIIADRPRHPLRHLEQPNFRRALAERYFVLMEEQN